MEKSTDTGKKGIIWRRDNSFAILAMKRNCETKVIDTIGLTRSAHEAYTELKAKYEGKTVTDLGAVLANIVRFTFDDRTTTIDEHVAEFDQRWNFMKGTLASGGFSDKVKDFGEALTSMAKSEQAKAEFLLISLPPFYNNLVENLCTKERYSHGDISRQVRLYVPARQKGTRKKEGTKNEPVVLKTDSKTLDKSKQCTYCQTVKGWKGIGHTKDECRTYKKEKKAKAKAKKAKAEEGSESDEERVTVCMVRVGKVGIRRKGWFQYDTGISHHTTNQLKFLRNTKQINLPVEAHNGTQSICHTKGTLKIIHNGRTVKHEDCLYYPTYSNLISGQ